MLLPQVGRKKNPRAARNLKTGPLKKTFWVFAATAINKSPLVTRLLKKGKKEGVLSRERTRGRGKKRKKR